MCVCVCVVEGWRRVSSRKLCLECGNKPQLGAHYICLFFSLLKTKNVSLSLSERSGKSEISMWILRVLQESRNPHQNVLKAL